MGDASERLQRLWYRYLDGEDTYDEHRLKHEQEREMTEHERHVRDITDVWMRYLGMYDAFASRSDESEPDLEQSTNATDDADDTDDTDDTDVRLRLLRILVEQHDISIQKLRMYVPELVDADVRAIDNINTLVETIIAESDDAAVHQMHTHIRYLLNNCIDFFDHIHNYLVEQGDINPDAQESIHDQLHDFVHQPLRGGAPSPIKRLHDAIDKLELIQRYIDNARSTAAQNSGRIHVDRGASEEKASESHPNPRQWRHHIISFDDLPDINALSEDILNIPLTSLRDDRSFIVETYRILTDTRSRIRRAIQQTQNIEQSKSAAAEIGRAITSALVTDSLEHDVAQHISHDDNAFVDNVVNTVSFLHTKLIKRTNVMQSDAEQLHVMKEYFLYVRDCMNWYQSLPTPKWTNVANVLESEVSNDHTKLPRYRKLNSIAKIRVSAFIADVDAHLRSERTNIYHGLGHPATFIDQLTFKYMMTDMPAPFVTR